MVKKIAVTTYCLLGITGVLIREAESRGVTSAIAVGATSAVIIAVAIGYVSWMSREWRKSDA